MLTPTKRTHKREKVSNGVPYNAATSLPTTLTGPMPSASRCFTTHYTGAPGCPSPIGCLGNVDVYN